METNYKIWSRYVQNDRILALASNYLDIKKQIILSGFGLRRDISTWKLSILRRTMYSSVVQFLCLWGIFQRDLWLVATISFILVVEVKGNVICWFYAFSCAVDCWLVWQITFGRHFQYYIGLTKCCLFLQADKYILGKYLSIYFWIHSTHFAIFFMLQIWDLFEDNIFDMFVREICLDNVLKDRDVFCATTK